MARVTVGNIVFGSDAQPEQGCRINLAMGHRHNLDGTGQGPHDRLGRLLGPDGIQEIALVEHHEVSARDLIPEHFLDGVVVVERRIGLALTAQRIQIGCESPLCERGTVDNGNHPVDRNPTLYHGPLKGLNQRFWKREPGCLDHDVLDGRCPPQDRVQRGYKVVSDRAAETAIGKFDDVFLWAGRVAASFENFAVNTDVPELIHDHSQSAPVCRRQYVAD